jgi:hypothetical protein
VQSNPSVAVKDAPPATVFILGPPRSGTSLVHKVLCLHPSTSYISNWVARVPNRPEIAAVNRVARWMPQMRQQSWFDRSGNAYVYGARRSLVRRAFPKPVEGEPVYTACGIDKAGHSENRSQSIQRLRDRITRIHTFSGHSSHFVNKRVANNRRVQLLTEAFPEARFIALVRDGRAVAYSLSRVDWWPDQLVWWYGDTPRHWEAQGGDPWELCAKDWVHELTAMEAGLADVDDDKKLLIRYEDLVTDPVASFTQLADFSGFPPSAEWNGRVAELTFPNKNTAWQDRLPESAAQTILQIQREHLERYDYPA